MGLDPATLARIDDVFRLDAPERLERLEDALERLARGGGEDARSAAAFEAHSLRGAAAIVGRLELVDLCSTVQDALAAPGSEPADLHGLAARVRREHGLLLAADVPPRRWYDRLAPRRFMTRLALILVLTLLPAFGVAAYNTIHAVGHSRSLIRNDAIDDAALAAESMRQLIAGAGAELDAVGSSSDVGGGSRAACRSLLARVTASSPTYAALAVVRGGRIVCGSPGAGSFLLSRGALFAQVRATGALAIGELRRVRHGSWIVPFAAPLPGSPGAVIATAVPISAFGRVLSAVPLDGNASVTLFDRRSVILLRRPDPQRIYTGMKGGPATASVSHPSGSTAELKGIDGVRRFFAFRSVGPWFVSVGRPVTAEEQHLVRTLLGTLLALALLGLGGILAGLTVARRALGRPLASLVGTARQLGDGDLAARSNPAVRGAELGELAAALDSMAGRLARRTAESDRARSELQAFATDLERRVGERTAELQDALRGSERQSEAKSGFLARLSHELRTPLNAIRGFSQLLSADELSAGQTEAVEHVSAASEHMIRLVDELLDTARIEAGEFRVEPTAVSVRGVVEEVAELQRGIAADAGIALEVGDVAELAVRADPGRLRQVLLNLVSNAIAYNRPGGRVTLAARGAPGARVELEVSDTGQGIPAGLLDRLFVPYDRLDRGPETSGLGLGLALSKRLVEAMDGTVDVESTVGEGTRFVGSLPQAESPPPSARTPAGGARGTSRTVLYVDDNPTNIRLVELLLRGRRVAVVGAASASAGFAAAEAALPQLILLDLELPDGSGETLLGRLRADERFRAVPIVIVSGDASRETVRRLLAAGADEYLTKPLEVDRAAALIERLLAR